MKAGRRSCRGRFAFAIVGGNRCRAFDVLPTPIRARKAGRFAQ